MKRPWKSRLRELALWALVSVVTALILIQFTETLLPAPNF